MLPRHEDQEGVEDPLAAHGVPPRPRAAAAPLIMPLASHGLMVLDREEKASPTGPGPSAYFLRLTRYAARASRSSSEILDAAKTGIMPFLPVLANCSLGVRTHALTSSTLPAAP